MQQAISIAKRKTGRELHAKAALFVLTGCKFFPGSLSPPPLNAKLRRQLLPVGPSVGYQMGGEADPKHQRRPHPACKPQWDGSCCLSFPKADTWVLAQCCRDLARTPRGSVGPPGKATPPARPAPEAPPTAPLQTALAQGTNPPQSQNPSEEPFPAAKPAWHRRTSDVAPPLVPPHPLSMPGTTVKNRGSGGKN